MAAMEPHHKFSLRSEFVFIKIAIITDDGTTGVGEPKRLKFAIDNLTKTVFGAAGACKSEFDILQLEKTSKNEPSMATLRVRTSGLQNLWGALTLCTSIDGKLCKLQVVHVASSLMELGSGRFLQY